MDRDENGYLRVTEEDRWNLIELINNLEKDRKSKSYKRRWWKRK